MPAAPSSWPTAGSSVTPSAPTLRDVPMPRFLLAEGVPISEVSRWLGHKSITTTVDLYGHLVPEASGRARDALDNAFRSTRVCPKSAPPPHDSAGSQVKAHGRRASRPVGRVLCTR